MKKFNFLSLVAAAAMVLSVGATTLSAEDMKCGAGKCGDAKKEMKKDGKCGTSKCGDAKKEMKKDGKCGDGKKEMKKEASQAGKCGKGKCGSN
ncbi:hypothetical protein FCU45_10705 [Sulfurimonas crateris]|uniref:Low-complexity protein n=1 Tax=Sulfurimonas crateris TaxID=2574727 RepID=A0A4U2Z3V8_9BACT|nr:hypothetical protein [Sulfurimonas crateris]TKI68474.1 hypothetical protein FCU45_10705 [Sulfurimonas crateris]